MEPLAAVSPGQVLAVYRNLECLGSGVITSTRCMDDVDGPRSGTGSRAGIVKYREEHLVLGNSLGESKPVEVVDT